MKEKKNMKAFTIVELIIVIAVIGILVLLALPKFLGHVEKAKLAQIVNDVKTHENFVDAGRASQQEFIDDWENVSSAKLKVSAGEKTLYDKRGFVENPLEVKNDEYFIIPAKTINTKLLGDFIVSAEGEVYYKEEEAEVHKECRIDGDWICIETLEDLNNIRNGSNSEGQINGKYLIVNDIDASSLNWDMISGEFTGILDGNNYTISGFNSNRNSEDIGMFKEINGGEIHNIRFANMKLDGNQNTTGIALKAKGNFDNIHVSSASVKSVSEEDNVLVASMFGELQGSVSNSSFDGEVVGPGENNVYIGGMIAKGSVSNSVLENSHGNGSVKTVSEMEYPSSTVGGLAGWVAEIENVHFSGDVSKGQSVGGIAGRSSYVNNVSFNGSVKGFSSGGIASRITEGEHGIPTGKCGVDEQNSCFLSHLNNAHIQGDIEGESTVGGALGMLDGSISNVFVGGNIHSSESLVRAGGAVGVGHFTPMRNVHVVGNVKVLNGGAGVGGVVGGGARGYIEDVSFKGDVVSSGNSQGGIVGDGIFTLMNAEVIGNVINTNPSSLGVGGILGDGISYLKNLKMTGDVISKGSRVGGIVGSNNGNFLYDEFGLIQNVLDENNELVSKDEAAIRNGTHVGNVLSEGDYIGGLAGNSQGTISDSTSKGKVQGRGDNVNGMVGSGEGKVTNSTHEGEVVRLK